MKDNIDTKYKKIPSVGFSAHHEATSGIEIINLRDFYRKSRSLKVNPYLPHRVQFHHLIYFTEKTGSHFIDFIRYPCDIGKFIFIRKNQIHGFDKENQPTGVMVLFTKEFLDEIYTTIRLPTFASGFDLSLNSPVQTVDGELKASSEALLEEMSKVSGMSRDDRLILQLMITTLLLKLNQTRGESVKSRLSEHRRKQFSHFTSLIEENYYRINDAISYAQLMGVSYKTLNELCKLSARRTPKQLIDEFTVLEAKRRLAIEEIQITQLAYELGFNEVTNFIKYFKKHTSDTPNQFQRNL